jgi:hypothetical protein
MRTDVADAMGGKVVSIESYDWWLRAGRGRVEEHLEF